MSIKFLSWNVRHFKGDEARASDVVSLISDMEPDVFALLEFKAKSVMRSLMFDSFPEYDFAITDSRQGTEIIAGYKRGRFRQTIWTQKREFLAGNEFLRPGGLLTVNDEGQLLNFLFLHTDSGTGRADYDNRQEMFKKIWKLDNRLRTISTSGKANLIALGDFNTMGRGTSLTGEDEIEELAIDAGNNGMRLLSKDSNETWHQWGKGPRGNRRKLKVSELDNSMRSDLDHIIISDGVEIELAGQNSEEAAVYGWNQLTGQERVDFLWETSDHAAIYGVLS